MSHYDIPGNTKSSAKSLFLGLAIIVMAVCGIGWYFQSNPVDSHQNGTASTSQSISSEPQGPRSCQCNQVLRNVVPAGSNVWTVVSDHVYLYHPDLDLREHEYEVFSMVAVLQWYINYDPQQSVRDVNDVPAGYTFGTSRDDAISPP